MSDEAHSFFCYPLKKGVLFSGHFTSILSMISCALAFSVFFRESSPDDSDSKLVSFSVACYAVFYIFMSRSLIRGVKEERRDKFVCWIVMSIITVIVFSSGIMFVLIEFTKGKFQENIFTSYVVLGTAVLCTFITGILVYCIRVVITQWRLYGLQNTEGQAPAA